MTHPGGEPFAALAREEREAAIREAFDSVAEADDASFDAALAAVADLVAWHGSALARDIGGLGRRLMMRTFSILDGHRTMGRISDLDEVYRILVVDHRVAARAAAGPEDLRAFHDELLFRVCPAVPAGVSLPPSPGIADPDVVDEATLRRHAGRIHVVDRVADRIRAWEDEIATRAPKDIDELSRALALDRKEHARARRLADWGVRAAVVSEQERDTIVATLGRFSKDDGGWPPGTSLASRAAVGDAIATLHDLFSSLT